MKSAFYWRDAVALVPKNDWNNGKRDAAEIARIMERIRVLESSGLHPFEIAKTVGISRRYVQQLRARAGLPPEGTGMMLATPLEETLFRSVETALYFAYSERYIDLPQSPVSRMASSPSRRGNGLGGVDGYAQAGMILSSLVRTVGTAPEHPDRAFQSPPLANVACGSACCKRVPTQHRWLRCCGMGGGLRRAGSPGNDGASSFARGNRQKAFRRQGPSRRSGGRLWRSPKHGKQPCVQDSDNSKDARKTSEV